MTARKASGSEDALREAMGSAGVEAAVRPAFMASRGAALRWLRKQRAAYVPADPDELRSLRRCIDHFLAAAEPFFSEGQSTLYRAVRLPEGEPWTATLRTDRMGIFWAFERDAARVYFTESEGDFNFDEALDGTVVEAVVGAGAVNWATSLIHVTLYEEEREIRLLPYKPVTIVAVDGARLPTPIRGSTGLVNHRWHDRR